MMLLIRFFPCRFYSSRILLTVRQNLRRRWCSTDPQIRVQRVTHPEFSDRCITEITLHRPKANAMGSTMLSELEECLDELEQEVTSDTSRCVVLKSSSPKVFSAGADLKERREMTLDQAEAFVTRLRTTMQRVATLPQPVIAAVEGVAVGGGLELALACDMRIASQSAIMGLPETSLAILPGAGGTQRLPRLIGVSRAKEIIWTGRRLSGEEAHAIGLVDKVVEAGTAAKEAASLAWKIAANAPIAIRASKEAIDQGSTAITMEEALEIERECYGYTLPTKDRLEGLVAFNEGRQPLYKGE